MLAACSGQSAPPGTTVDRAKTAPDLARLRQLLGPHAGHRFDAAGSVPDG
jgi:hypothetical protein